MALEDSEVQRALVVTAHPDDVDFGASGTIALWTAAGIEVTYCIVTDGDAGGFDPVVPRSEIAGIRRREQTAAAAVVGVTDLRFLGYPDGRLEVTLGLRQDIARVIREVRPQRVLVQSPQRNWTRIYGSHPDHMAAGEAALCAIYPDARNPFTFPEIAHLEAWSVPETWVMALDEADRVVDITDVFDLKLKALQAHASQHPEPDQLEPRVRWWNGANAQAHGLPEGRLAETFRVMDTA